MNTQDRLGNKAEDLTGRAKEAAGSVADNDELRDEGRADQAKAGVKDKFQDAKDKLDEKTDDLL